MRRRNKRVIPATLAGLLTVLVLGGSLPGCVGEAPDSGKQTTSWGDLVVPLTGTEPGRGEETSDLMALSRWVGGAQVVGLGEEPHGVHEYHRLAHRVFMHLAQGDGFSVFALEISQAHANRLNEYVLGKRDDLETLLAQRWWPAEVFYDGAFRDLLIWMRRYNRVAGSPVQIAGFDFKQPFFAVEDLVERLRSLDIASAAEVEALYSSIPKKGFGVFPNVYGFHSTLTTRLPSDSEGEELRVEMQVRGRGVSHGSVGLAVRFDNDWRSQSRQLLSHEVGTEWTPVDVSTAIPAGAEELHIDVFHRGNGTAWFGGLLVGVNGRRVELGPHAELLEVRPLMMPHLQAMDYSYRTDDDVLVEGTGALRVDCADVVDEILAGVKEAESLVRHQVALQEDRLSRDERVWLTQLSRLIVQSAEWRTLAEANRDVFMAENVDWLLNTAFPGSRILLLAHKSHTERIPQKMGGFLAESLGRSYAPVTLLAQSGQYAYFGDVKSHKPGDELILFDLKPGEGGLAQRLHEEGQSDVLVNLAGASEAQQELEWLTSGGPPGLEATDVAIVISKASPILSP